MFDSGSLLVLSLFLDCVKCGNVVLLEVVWMWVMLMIIMFEIIVSVLLIWCIIFLFDDILFWYCVYLDWWWMLCNSLCDNVVVVWVCYCFLYWFLVLCGKMYWFVVVCWLWMWCGDVLVFCWFGINIVKVCWVYWFLFCMMVCFFW